jgi:hypothetical protein
LLGVATHTVLFWSRIVWCTALIIRLSEILCHLYEVQFFFNISFCGFWLCLLVEILSHFSIVHLIDLLISLLIIYFIIYVISSYIDIYNTFINLCLCINPGTVWCY